MNFESHPTTAAWLPPKSSVCLADPVRIYGGGVGRVMAARGGDPYDREVQTAVAFLRLLKPTKAAAYHSPGSYGLKHAAETWGRYHRMEPYVSNGALIAAAVSLGYPVRHFIRNDPNVAIGIHRRSLRPLLAIVNEYRKAPLNEDERRAEGDPG